MQNGGLVISEVSHTTYIYQEMFNLFFISSCNPILSSDFIRRENISKKFAILFMDSALIGTAVY